MNPGGYIAVGFFSLLAIGVVIGLSFDARHAIREFRERRGEALIRERMASGVAFVEALLLQLEEIRGLPTAQVEVDPSKRRRTV